MRALTYNAIMMFTLIGSLLPSCFAKVLSESDFSKASMPLAWEQLGQGVIKFRNGGIEISTPSGPGMEWASTSINYKYGFSLLNVTLSLVFDIEYLTSYRDIQIVIRPRNSSMHRDGTVWINIGGECYVRKFKHGKLELLKKHKLSVVPNVKSKIVMVLSGGCGSIKISNALQSEEINLGKLFDKEELVEPFTIQVGVSQHGKSDQAGVIIISKVKIITSNETELSASEIYGNNSGKSDKVKYISLDKYANRRFWDNTPGDGNDGWTDQGINDMRYIPTGYQFFRNVPFFINNRLDVVGNSPSPASIAVQSANMPTLPVQSKPIMIDDKAAYIYFLQTVVWAGIPNKTCADYLIEYTDGAIRKIPVIVGKNVNDWWDPRKPSDAYVAWLGKNEVKYPIGIYLYEWKNPEPDKKIKSVIVKSSNKSAGLFLIALTLSDKKIEIGSEPKKYHELSEGLCEYRQRPKISLAWKPSPQKIVVKRSLPVDSTSTVKKTRFDVTRYHANIPATVTCSIDGLKKIATLAAGELKASFVFVEPSVLKYIKKNSDGFEVIVTTDDPEGLGSHIYGNNPNLLWIPGGEDFSHGIYSIIGTFHVTGWLPIHKISKYITCPPAPEKPAPVTIERKQFQDTDIKISWLGSKVCLNGPWKWQPAKNTLANRIPVTGWEPINIPANVGVEIFQRNQNYISAWFQKEIYIPEKFGDYRLFLEFNGISDFATVYLNGKKCGEHAGIQPFEVEVTRAALPGQKNIISVRCDNVYRGIKPFSQVWILNDKTVSKYKGHAYCVEVIRGAWDQKPDEIELLLDGVDIAKKSTLDQVIQLGDGRYYRKQEWNTSILYFSLPGNAKLHDILTRLQLIIKVPGVCEHLTRHEFPHHWREPRPRDTGITNDLFLRIEGKARISDVFIKPSVRKKSLDVGLEFDDISEPLFVKASVFDGKNNVLQFDTVQISKKCSKLSIHKAWNNPELWAPSNPYLYYLRVDLLDKDKSLVDRKFVRFGFKEFWIDGTDFILNGKPVFIAGESVVSETFLPIHRAQLRYLYADRNQNANINMVRWHLGGMVYPETAEVADEMGMLLEPECEVFWLTSTGSEKRDNSVKEKIQYSKWVVDLVKKQRNHPSIAMWSADNEKFVLNPGDKPSRQQLMTAENVLQLNQVIKKADPMRPVDNQGDNGFLYTGLYVDPRLEIMNTHYVQTIHLADWKKKIKKPIMMGEMSLGGPFAWTYQNIKDPETFWKQCNPACSYSAQRIKELENVEYKGIWPFGACQLFDPTVKIWEGITYMQPTPKVPWPSMSGENIKPSHYLYGRNSFPQFWDSNVPRGVHLRTYDPLKDFLPEVTRIEPRLSPEVIVQVLDKSGNPVSGRIVWLVPTSQPISPYGVITDNQGKAWFWCKGGYGEYLACMHINGKWYSVKVIPELPGDWLQVKKVEAELPICSSEQK